MAGSLSVSTVKRPSRGVVKHKVTFTADASGNVTAAIVGLGVGKLVGVALPHGAYDFGQCVITVSDADSGASLLAIDTQALLTSGELFSGTTTGDTTGGTSEDLFTTNTAHGLTAGDRIVIVSKSGGTLPTVGTTYFVLATDLTATEFHLSATAGGAVIEIGATDITAMTWRNLTTALPAFVARYLHPTAVITDNAGVAVTADATAPNVNRDIFVSGNVKIGVAQAGNLGTGSVHLIVDETVRPRA